MKTALVLSFSDLATDPRVNRQIRFLRGRYRLITAGFAPSALPDVAYVPFTPPGWFSPVETRVLTWCVVAFHFLTALW